MEVTDALVEDVTNRIVHKIQMRRLKMNKLKTLQDFIAFYEAIPEEKWTTGKYGDNKGCFCALGHLGMNNSHHPSTAPVNVKNLGKVTKGSRFTIPNINDGSDNYRELGDTPKERIINYLTLVELKMI